ncbi:hypothetical protein TI39_contig517g00006 [Zymoseptoria brevis]|uniref:Uncharacterized protein n=1 Tax=Zymoseptoria brevis TaxID=1047168 RepID=A0A0F4GM54_9PEZI|nr:hypothetical protein TI39_contig517g00006 [Zymoseptoria brevis]
MTLFPTVAFRHDFELHGASALRIAVEVEGAVDIEHCVGVYICQADANMRKLVVRTMRGLPITFNPGHHGDNQSGSGARKIRLTITRGMLHPIDGSKGFSATSEPPSGSSSGSSPTAASPFVPLPGHEGQSYCFEFGVESRGNIHKTSYLRRTLWSQEKLEHRIECRNRIESLLGTVGTSQWSAAEGQAWKAAQSGTPAYDRRVATEETARWAITSDIVRLDWSIDKALLQVEVIGRPPETCDCPDDHTKPPPSEGARTGSIKARQTTSTKATKIVRRPAINLTPTAGESMSKKCGKCDKVKPPPRGKKLGQRIVGGRKVTKYVPLDADDGYGRARRPVHIRAPAQVDAEPDLLDDGAYVPAVPKSVLHTPADVQGETSVTAQEQSTAVQNTVQPTPFDEQGETSVTTQEQSGATQDATETAPDNAQNVSPETPDAPGPRAVSSPPDFRKRAGDSSLEEPPAKRPSVASRSTTRDDDDEEIDLPKPNIKIEEDEVTIIEDKNGDIALRFKHRKASRNKSVEETRLQHQLQLVEMDEERLRLARKKLELKHKLEAFRRPRGFQKENPIKIED